MSPLTGRAGQVAVQPITITRRPRSEAKFHSAGTRRIELVTNRRSAARRASGQKRVPVMKSKIPCSARGRPVAMVVHRAGDRISRSESNTP